MQSNGGEDGEGQLNDDFLEQMLSSWPEPKSPWDIAGGSGDVQKLFSLALAGKSPEDPNPFDDSSSLLASRIRHQQIGAGLVPLPLCLGSVDSATGGGGADPLYNGSLQQCSAASHFQQQQGSAAAAQGYGGAPSAAPPRQRVRARRGQATDPHSIAERLRRERIAERMKALQELVPNANKTDKASMLDEIIDYVKFLQLQVKVLSMSRLGGAAAVAPLVADVSSQAGGGGSMAAASSSDNLAVTEHQVAKLMEEDMGSAMQYLQGKGLCLMPISLASAISTATCHPRSFIPAPPDGPTSPSMSVLTVQSAMANGVDATTKDAASISKP